MIKIILVVIIILIGLITYTLCVAAADGDRMANECYYNWLDGCKGKCCKKCESQNTCKMACKNDVKTCGGSIKRSKKK